MTIARLALTEWEITHQGRVLLSHEQSRHERWRDEQSEWEFEQYLNELDKIEARGLRKV